VHKNNNFKTSYFWSYCPLPIFILEFCQEDNAKSIQATDLQFHRQIDLIEEKCSAQEPYFWSYCSLLIFILEFCPQHNFETMQGIYMKFYR